MMTFKGACLISCCLLLAATVPSEKKGWRGIVPLRASRANVEALLGPSPEEGYGVTYDLGSEAVTFEYSSGPCPKERKDGWNVPADTVIRIRVSAATKPRFADLKIEKEKFEKVDDPELEGGFEYINQEDGILYEVQGGLIVTTQYGPSAKDSHLHCNNIP